MSESDKVLDVLNYAREQIRMIANKVITGEISHDNLTLVVDKLDEIIEKKLNKKTEKKPKKNPEGSLEENLERMEKNMEVVQLIVDRGVDLDCEYEDGITFGKQMQINEENKKKYIDVQFHLAIQENNMENFNILIKYKPDVNKKFKGATPLYRAVESNNIEMIKILLELGANCDM